VVGLVVGDLAGSGAMERIHSELIRRMSSQFDFVVLSHTIEADLRELVTWYRIPTPRRPAVLARPLFFVVGSIYAALLDVDILHTCGAVVGNRAELSTVHFCHSGFRRANGGLAPKEMPFVRRMNTTLMRSFAIGAERWCYRGAWTGVLGAVSRQVEDEIETHYKRARVVLTPNGVDVAAFRPDHQVRKEIRIRRGVSFDDVVALFVGGDWDRKGLAIAIGAIAEARRRGSHVRLWVDGSGDEERFSRIAIKLGVGDLVDFLGRDSEPARWYKGADLFLCCSVYETFSLVIVEAAAAGLPVISTPVGVAREIVLGVDGECGGTLVERDPAAIGRVVAELAENGEERKRMGKIGYRRAQAYSWDRAAEELADVYGQILANNGRPRRSIDRGKQIERRSGSPQALPW
jgi:glycosyltransferase involved in cell wall biosynthesis